MAVWIAVRLCGAQAKQVVMALHEALLHFDFRNGPMRKVRTTRAALIALSSIRMTPPADVTC